MTHVRPISCAFFVGGYVEWVLPDEGHIIGTRRSSRIAAILAAILTLCASCRAEDALLPRRGVSIEVDSAVYHLKPYIADFIIWSYTVDITVTIRNDSDRKIYLSQYCRPWFVTRADADTTSLILGEFGGCVGTVTEPILPLPILPTLPHTQRVELSADNSWRRMPRVSIANDTGTLALNFVFTDRFGRGYARVRSAPFRVVAP